MVYSQIYILISMIILLVIAILIFFFKKNKKQKTFTPFAGLALGFVIAGIAFGDNRFIGYGLIGIGVILALIDAVRKFRK